MRELIGRPAWISRRRLLEQKISELHKCSNLAYLKQVLSQIIRAHLHEDLFVAPKIVTSFSLCHQINSALCAFSLVQNPNTLLFNSLMRAQIENDDHCGAFSTLSSMQNMGIKPDNFTYQFLLKARSKCSSLHTIEMIHTLIEKLGFFSGTVVLNSLIDAYVKFNQAGVYSAKKLFTEMTERDIVSWNSLIGGLSKAGDFAEACKLFDEMPERDIVTWNTILDGYVKAGDMNAAFKLFEEMPQSNFITWSTMISGYSKVGDMNTARSLFDQMPFKNIVSWTIMISGYAEKDLAKEAMALYNQMEEQGLILDVSGFISILSACSESGLLNLGTLVHSALKKVKFNCNGRIANVLIDMYVKCGVLEEALEIFNLMISKDVISWNTLLLGYAMHGCAQEALKLYSRMMAEEYKPDKGTFLGLLCACSHSGLVDEGLSFFHSMYRDYGVAPQVEHFGCVIDLLGRVGRFDDALDLLGNMPFEVNDIILGTLLRACRMHNASGLTEKMMKCFAGLGSDAGNLLTLSNIYAGVGDWDKAANVRAKMRSIGVCKPSGASWIELDNEVHEFTVFDMSHPQWHLIYEMIEWLSQHLLTIKLFHHEQVPSGQPD